MNSIGAMMMPVIPSVVHVVRDDAVRFGVFQHRLEQFRDRVVVDEHLGNCVSIMQDFRIVKQNLPGRRPP